MYTELDLIALHNNHLLELHSEQSDGASDPKMGHFRLLSPKSNCGPRFISVSAQKGAANQSERQISSNDDKKREILIVYAFAIKT